MIYSSWCFTIGSRKNDQKTILSQYWPGQHLTWSCDQDWDQRNYTQAQEYFLSVHIQSVILRVPNCTCMQYADCSILHDSSYNRQLYQTWFLHDDKYSRWGSNSNYVEETWCYLAATTTAGSYDVFISVWLASNIYWREKELVIDDLEFTYLQTSHVSCSYATLLLTRLQLNHITAQERCAKPRPDPRSALHLHPSSRIGSPCTSFSSSMQILQTYIYTYKQFNENLY